MSTKLQHRANQTPLKRFERNVEESVTKMEPTVALIFTLIDRLFFCVAMLGVAVFMGINSDKVFFGVMPIIPLVAAYVLGSTACVLVGISNWRFYQDLRNKRPKTKITTVLYGLLSFFVCVCVMGAISSTIAAAFPSKDENPNPPTTVQQCSTSVATPIANGPEKTKQVPVDTSPVTSPAAKGPEQVKQIPADTSLRQQAAPEAKPAPRAAVAPGAADRAKQ